MQTRFLLAAAAAATGALAVRDLSGAFPQKYARALEARDQSACIAVVAAHSTLTNDFPMPPTALASADVAAITDPCSFPSITGAAGQVVTSYSSALQSWQDAHITEIRSIWQACSDVPQVSAAIGQYADAICSTALAPITSADGTGAAATASGSAPGQATATGSGTAATASGTSGTSASANAAPRETGLVVAAAGAAAALIGAVML